DFEGGAGVWTEGGALPLRLLPQEVALPEHTFGDQSVERWFHVGCGESVAYRQGGCRHGAPRSHRAEEDAFEAGVGGQAGVERGVGRRDPGATGPELDERDAALRHQRPDEAI